MKIDTRKALALLDKAGVEKQFAMSLYFNENKLKSDMFVALAEVGYDGTELDEELEDDIYNFIVNEVVFELRDFDYCVVDNEIHVSLRCFPEWDQDISIEDMPTDEFDLRQIMEQTWEIADNVDVDKLNKVMQSRGATYSSELEDMVA